MHRLNDPPLHCSLQSITLAACETSGYCLYRNMQKGHYCLVVEKVAAEPKLSPERAAVGKGKMVLASAGVICRPEKTGVAEDKAKAVLAGALRFTKTSTLS
jgi:hypothetical protein